MLEVLVFVKLTAIPPGSTVLDGDVDNTVVFTVDDRLLTLVVDKLDLFSKALAVELITVNTVVFKMEELLENPTLTVAFWTDNVVAVVKVVEDKFNEIVLLDNAVEFNTLARVEFNDEFPLTVAFPCGGKVRAVILIVLMGGVVALLEPKFDNGLPPVLPPLNG